MHAISLTPPTISTLRLLLTAAAIIGALPLSAVEDLNALTSWRKFRAEPHALYAQAVGDLEIRETSQRDTLPMQFERWLESGKREVNKAEQP